MIDLREKFEAWYLLRPHCNETGLNMMAKSESGLLTLYSDGITQVMFEAYHQGVKENEQKPVEFDYDRSIHSNPDHTAWAEFFIKTWPNGCSDEDTMASWFANAMMAKYDSINFDRIKVETAIELAGIFHDGKWRSTKAMLICEDYAKEVEQATKEADDE